MWKRFLYVELGLLLLLLLVPACTGGNSSESTVGKETGAQTVAKDTATETSPEEETETEAETESPYLIPDPTRVDLTTFTEKMFKSSFQRGNSSYPELCAEGVRLIGRSESRDPWVFWDMSSMYQEAGYPASEDGKT